MFPINLQKLSDFDTQILTLINLAPDKWSLGAAPHYVCHHMDFGWFGTSMFGLGAQATQINTNAMRRLTWRGQILLRRKVKEIRQSAVNADTKPSFIPPPDKSFKVGYTWSSEIMQRFWRANTFGGGQSSKPDLTALNASASPGAMQVQAMHAHQNMLIKQMVVDASQQMTSNPPFKDQLKDLYAPQPVAGPAEVRIRRPAQPSPQVFGVTQQAIPPSNAHFMGKSYDELLAAGAPPALIDSIWRDECTVRPDDARVESLARWCRDHLP